MNSNGEQTLTDVDQNIDFPFYPEEYDYFAFTARSSEPLDTLTLSLTRSSSPLTQEIDLKLVSVSTDSMEWKFQIEATELLAEDYTLNFAGEDLSENELLNLKNYVDAGFKVPSRRSSTGTSASIRTKNYIFLSTDTRRFPANTRKAYP